MTYLWDTDTCIYFLEGNESIRKKVKDIGVDKICTTIVSIAELKFGAYNSSRIESNPKRISELQQNMKILSKFDDNIATAFAKNKALLKKRGITVTDFDLLIAGFANSNGLIIVSNNISHYRHIPDLQTENWIEK